VLRDSLVGHKKQEEPMLKGQWPEHCVLVAFVTRADGPSWTLLQLVELKNHSSSGLLFGISTDGEEKSGFGYAACSGRIGGDGSVSTSPKP
jgi:hypothetical protein